MNRRQSLGGGARGFLPLKGKICLDKPLTNKDIWPNLDIKLKGFTLAEVLITLGVIGVVAAMTLPTLVSKYKERQYITGLKKAVSVIDNAYHLALYENGGNKDFGYLPPKYVPLPEDEGTGVYNENGNYNSDVFFRALSKHLNVVKDCGREGKTGCFPETITHPFDGRTWNLLQSQGNSRRFFVLQDGIAIGVTGGADLYIDVNGIKKPNILGVDVFQVKLGDKALQHYDDASGDVMCYTNIFTCAAWVLVNENLDYLHCDDLSWHGKTKCN